VELLEGVLDDAILSRQAVEEPGREYIRRLRAHMASEEVLFPFPTGIAPKRLLWERQATVSPSSALILFTSRTSADARSPIGLPPIVCSSTCCNPASAASAAARPKSALIPSVMTLSLATVGIH